MKTLLCIPFVLLAACGGDDGGGAKDRTMDFIGTWTYSAGSTIMEDCMTSMDSSSDLTGDWMIAAGTAGAELDTPFSDDCPPVGLDVTGSVASVKSGWTCTLSNQDNTIMGTFTIPNYSITLSGDGMQIMEAGTINVVISGAATDTCVDTLAAVSTKKM